MAKDRGKHGRRSVGRQGDIPPTFYSAPHTPYLDLRRPTSKGRGGERRSIA